MTGWLIMNGILSVGLLLVIVGMLAWAIVTDPGARGEWRSRTRASPHYRPIPYRSREVRP